MSDGFDLSFKNKEVRMWFYIVLPLTLIGVVYILINDSEFSYISYLWPTAAWMIYYIWRYFYRKRQRQLRETEGL